MIISVRHTGIVVRDIKESVKFYEALGFVVFSKDLEEGKFIDQVTGLQGVKLEWFKLKSPDGYLLELLKYHSHSDFEGTYLQKSNKLGCSHIAFGVDDIKKTCEIIKKMGGSVVNTPAITNNKKVKVAYCHDLEGVLMELVEVI
jgi:catechol 2,3-dioxygenase-like lactoylglutathione lyase family enzyme